MKYITIECSCGRKAHVPASRFGSSVTDLKVDLIADKIKKFQCSECKKPANFIHSDKDQLLFDLTNLTYCTSCEIPISLARLNAVPGTSVCALCAHEGANDIRIPPPHPQPPSNLASCPVCEKYGRHSRTEMRQNGSDKSWFVGCSIYPSCRWTKNL